MTSTELIDAIEGPPPTPRQLEDWRALGLLPPPVRQAKGRSVWRSPPGTLAQLQRLLELRHLSTNPDALVVVLWIEGFAVTNEHARRGLAAVVDRWVRESAQLRSSVNSHESETEGINALAGELAGKRRKSAVPKIVRMPAAERTNALGLFLSLALGASEEIAARSGDVIHLERMLGLRSGHGGGLAGKLPLGLSGDVATPPSPDAVARAIADANDVELELVRTLVNAYRVWLPALAEQLLAEQGPIAAPFVTLVRGMGPLDVVSGALYLLFRLHSSDMSELPSRELLSALQPGIVDLDFLEGFPLHDRQRAFDQLPADRQQALAQAYRARRRPLPEE